MHKPDPAATIVAIARNSCLPAVGVSSAAEPSTVRFHGAREPRIKSDAFSAIISTGA